MSLPCFRGLFPYFSWDFYAELWQFRWQSSEAKNNLNCQPGNLTGNKDTHLKRSRFTFIHASSYFVGLRMFSNYWMRLSRIWTILQIKEGVIHRGRRPRWITTSEICRILHILRKPNSIIALLFIQNISSFLKEFRHYALCFAVHQI